MSIGCQEDDRRYFKSFECKEYLTLDKDKKFKPDIELDIQKDIYQDIQDFDLDRRFNDIFTFELWEYIFDPLQVLDNLKEMLKKGGRLWISFPFSYPHHNPEKEDMLRYTRWFWEKVLPEIGFVIEEFETRNWFNQTGYFQSVSADRMRPSKTFRHHNMTGGMIICRKK